MAGDMPKRVLFIGNSYTFYWNLPQTVSAMARSQDIEIACRQSTGSGATLQEHWNSEKDLKTLDILREGDFDAVVLQEHSMRFLEDPDSMMRHGKLWAEEIKRKKAKIYIFLTWAREYNPYWQKSITEQYTSLCTSLPGSELVPVGPAWQRARELRGNLPLYDADQSHPSALGQYLTACVFYGVFTKKSPLGLPNRLTCEDRTGEKIYLNIQAEGDALFCQHVAQEILSSASASRAVGTTSSGAASAALDTSVTLAPSPQKAQSPANSKGFAA